MEGFAMIQAMVLVVMVGELVKPHQDGHGESKEGAACFRWKVVQDSHGTRVELQMSLAKFKAVGLGLFADSKRTAIHHGVVMKVNIKRFKEDVETTVEGGNIGGGHELSRCRVDFQHLLIKPDYKLES